MTNDRSIFTTNENVKSGLFLLLLSSWKGDLNISNLHNTDIMNNTYEFYHNKNNNDNMRNSSDDNE